MNKVDWGLPWDEETLSAWEAQIQLLSGDKLWELFETLRVDPSPSLEPLRVAFAKWMWPPYRVLSSLYNGTCRVCGEPLKVGDSVAWARTAGATHLLCADQHTWPTPERMFPRYRPGRGKGLRCEQCQGHIHVADQAKYGHVLCRKCRTLKSIEKFRSTHDQGGT